MRLHGCSTRQHIWRLFKRYLQNVFISLINVIISRLLEHKQGRWESVKAKTELEHSHSETALCCINSDSIQVQQSACVIEQDTFDLQPSYWNCVSSFHQNKCLCKTRKPTVRLIHRYKNKLLFSLSSGRYALLHKPTPAAVTWVRSVHLWSLELSAAAEDSNTSIHWSYMSL